MKTIQSHNMNENVVLRIESFPLILFIFDSVLLKISRFSMILITFLSLKGSGYKGALSPRAQLQNF